MPKSIYLDIYRDLKQKIEEETYIYQDFLPPENTLVKEYECSRNTIRRAISQLASDGYVQSLQGKGVRILYQKGNQTMFSLGKIETFRESALKNGLSYHTKVLLFTELILNEKLAKKTCFPVGSEIYYIQRAHYIDNQALIMNHNFFLKEYSKGLTAEIAEQSIYDYLENELQMSIVNSKRIVTVERATEIDAKYLALNTNEFNCMAVITSYTYNSDGVMFEFTQSIHHPEHFSFQDNAVRK